MYGIVHIYIYTRNKNFCLVNRLRPFATPCYVLGPDSSEKPGHFVIVLPSKRWGTQNVTQHPAWCTAGSPQELPAPWAGSPPPQRIPDHFTQGPLPPWLCRALGWYPLERWARIPRLLFSRNSRIQVSAYKGSFFPVPVLGLAARLQTRPCMKTQLRNYKGKLYHFLLTQKCLKICSVWSSSDRTD